MKKILRLGTRRSLLAWSQSQWVANEIQKRNPNVEVQLVGIETQGDRIQHLPLQKVEGKDFFVKELDEALLQNQADLSVHSMKDLSLERPKGIVLAAVPPRENPRDVILFHPEVIERLKKGKTLRIGTSSPRRLENIPSFLEKALPRWKNNPKLEFVEIRGNVNTRISRLREPENSERHLDGVVLAFAGLIRLWKDPAIQKDTRPLLKHLRWMILPLSECPSAPAQGALAIECRESDSQTLSILQTLHDPKTQEASEREREVLSIWGGGCHQKLGATAIRHPQLGSLFWVKGLHPKDGSYQELDWTKPSKPHFPKIWDGSQWRKSVRTTPLSLSKPLPKTEATFIAHWRALTPEVQSWIETQRVYTSGVQSWVQLAQKGVWVEGCAENLGFSFFEKTLQEPVLGLPTLENWSILTHESAEETWEKGTVIPTYRVDFEKPGDLSELKSATHLFWGSGSQYLLLKDHIPREAHHACGPGKTADRLKSLGVSPLQVFPSGEAWRNWVNSHQEVL